MRTPGRSARARLASPGAVAAAWALATFAALAGLQGAPGVSRDEAAVIAAAGRGAEAVHEGSPPLAPALAAAGRAVAIPLGLPAVRATRLGSAVAGALLSALLAAAAWILAGPAAAALAPALLWLGPRTLHAGLVATPDVAAAALALGAALAWRRAAGPDRSRPAAVVAGLLAGAAVLARADTWTLLPAFALHAWGVRLLGRRSAPGAPAPGAPLGSVALAAAVAAALVAAAWPGSLRADLAAWRPAPGAAALPLTALAALPAPLLWVLAGGLAHAAVRAFAAARARAAAASVSDELLLALAGVVAFGGAALSHAPAGARPILPALPFLAALGARALLHGAALAWPARSEALAGALALLVLYPGVRAAAVSFPNGSAAWGELAGGAAGAASRGLRRQDGGEAAAALLPAINARAADGARVLWVGIAPEAVALYARDGRLRPDLQLAAAPAQADLAVVALDGGSRDAEYRAWSALRTARPAAGVYADEVPLALVYARAGAWR